MAPSLGNFVEEITVEYSKAISAYFAQVKSKSGSEEDALNRIVAVDHQLETALETVDQHQQIHKQIEQVENQIEDIDRWMKSTLRSLIESEKRLSEWIYQAKKKQEFYRSKQSLEGIPIDDLLAFAKRISSTTSAPPNWNPSQPLGLHRPPAPQEAHIRSSILFQQESYLDGGNVKMDTDDVKDELVHGVSTTAIGNVHHVFHQPLRVLASNDKASLLQMDIDDGDEED